MKTLRLLSFVVLAMLACISCKKKDETPVLDATSEEAATIMATALCTDAGGTMSQVNDAISLAEAESKKSTLYDSSFTISSVSGAPITYTYQMSYHYGFVNPNSYQLVYESAGSYSAPYVTASIEASGTIGISGFLAGEYYTCYGQGQRQGSFAVKVGNRSSVTGTVNTSYSDFRFSKSTGLLESGTATMTVDGKTSTGLNFGFTGTFVYEGNYTGSLTINGRKFYINISTGTVQ